ncbi:putative ribonuclease H-like domain-containing protein [Tanacetum coccineum]
MSTLKFADTHNMVAFLSKPTESDRFEQIVDFLNAHPIRYALTVNPTIYISCNEQFWSTSMAKTINGEVQLHARVDGKKIVITKSSVRRDLQLADEEGVDCLPNSAIVEQLPLMGLQAQEQEELSVEEKATLFQQLLEKRRNDFAAKRAKEKRNKPPTKAQQRKIMCTYLKNMEGYKLKDLKSKGSKDNLNSTNNVNTVSSNVNAASTNKVNVVGGKTSIELTFDPNMPALKDYSIFDFSIDDEDDGAEDDMNNLDTTIQVSPIPTIRIHKDHPLDQVIGDLQLATQTRKMSKNLKEHGFKNQKKVIHALKDPSWIEAMQEELLQFKLQEFWTLMDLPHGKRAIGSKWVFRNKKDEMGIVIRNKARLVAQ